MILGRGHGLSAKADQVPVLWDLDAFEKNRFMTITSRLFRAGLQAFNKQSVLCVGYVFAWRRQKGRNLPLPLPGGIFIPKSLCTYYIKAGHNLEGMTASKAVVTVLSSTVYSTIFEPKK